MSGKRYLGKVSLLSPLNSLSVAQAGGADTPQNSVSVGVGAKIVSAHEGGSVLRSSSETRGARRCR